MNATTQAMGSGREPPFLDLTLLRRLRYGQLMLGVALLPEPEVLDDEEGEITRFLCRAPRNEFDGAEAFVAAAVRRYFRPVADPGLREMMFADALAGEHFAQRVGGQDLRRHLEREMPDGAPRQWLAPFLDDGVEDAVLLSSREGRLEVVARSAQHWIYGLLEA